MYKIVSLEQRTFKTLEELKAWVGYSILKNNLPRKIAEDLVKDNYAYATRSDKTGDMSVEWKLVKDTDDDAI